MRNRAKGFTLVELIVAVALFALLLTFAYPSYTSYIQNAQIRTAAESMINVLQLARRSHPQECQHSVPTA